MSQTTTPQESKHGMWRPQVTRRPKTTPSVQPRSQGTDSQEASYVRTAAQRFEPTEGRNQSRSTAKEKVPRPPCRKQLQNLHEDLRKDIKQWKLNLKTKSPKPGFTYNERDLAEINQILHELENIYKIYQTRLCREFPLKDQTTSPHRIHSRTDIHSDDARVTTRNTAIALQPTSGEVTGSAKQERQIDSRDKQIPNRLHEENSRLQQKVKQLDAEKEKLENHYRGQLGEIEKKCQKENEVLTKLQADVSVKKRKIVDLEKEIASLKHEKEDALTRLSEIAGKKLHDDNANIADLSTDIRPTKISEKFRECYDNEWTEAFEELTEEEGYEEERAIRHLLKILKYTFCYCEKQSADFDDKIVGCIQQFPYTEEARDVKGNAIPKDTKSIIKDLRKAVVADVVLRLQTKFVRDLNVELVTPLGSRTEIFTKKCVELTWYMVVQTPPMEILADLEEGTEVDRDLFVYYTTQGKYVDFLVWPCVRLQKQGPLLSKGVVQGRDAKEGHGGKREDRSKDTWEGKLAASPDAVTSPDKEENSQTNQIRATQNAMMSFTNASDVLQEPSRIDPYSDLPTSYQHFPSGMRQHETVNSVSEFKTFQSTVTESIPESTPRQSTKKSQSGLNDTDNSIPTGQKSNPAVSPRQKADSIEKGSNDTKTSAVITVTTSSATKDSNRNPQWKEKNIFTKTVAATNQPQWKQNQSTSDLRRTIVAETTLIEPGGVALPQSETNTTQP